MVILYYEFYPRQTHPTHLTNEYVYSNDSYTYSPSKVNRITAKHITEYKNIYLWRCRKAHTCCIAKLESCRLSAFWIVHLFICEMCRV